MFIPKVSIILTSYNKPSLIGKAIESVLNQTFPDWELIIMDDSSNERTTRVINSYLHDKRIHYYNSSVKDEDRYKTVRYATLINQAIPLTKGNYISYLTDDTEYLPKRLNVMVGFLEKHLSIQIVYSGQIIFNMDNKLNTISKYIRKTRGSLNRAANRVDHCSVMHTRTILKKVFEKYGDYWNDDPKYWHNGDAVFWSRLNQFHSFYPINQILDHSYKTPQSFQNLNAYLPENIPNGTLVKGLSKEVYVIEDQNRRFISNEMLRQLNYDQRNIVEIPDPFLFKYSLDMPIDDTIFNDHSLFPNYRLVKTRSCADIYYIQNNKKRMFITKGAFEKYKFKLQDVVIVTDDYLHLFPTGSPIMEKITKNTLLPEHVLFRDNSHYFLNLNNFLHPIPLKVLKKLCLSETNAVQLFSKEKLFFKKGEAISWEVEEV